MGKDIHENPNTKGIPANFHFNAPVTNVNYRCTIYTGGDGSDPKQATVAKEQGGDALDKAYLREEILEYVGRIFEFYTTKWQLHYKELWNDILDMPVVDVQIYRHGKQRDTHFDRNLVGNIIGYLNRYHLYENDIVPGTFTHSLAKDGKGKSVRDAMSENPKPEICEAIKALMNSKKYV